MPFRVVEDHRLFGEVGKNPTEEALNDYINLLSAEVALSLTVLHHLYPKAKVRNKKKKKVDDPDKTG